MRLDSTDYSDQYKVWMTDDELEQLCRAASNDRDDLIIQLGITIDREALVRNDHSQLLTTLQR